jgi:phosphatidylinositol alpha-mannosyltransferase
LRVALLCPYDWNRPGGVRTHVAGLATALRLAGHRVDVVAAGRRAGDAGEVRLMGTTTPFRINGSVARLAITPAATWRVWRALRAGAYDVVHLHEPIIPMVCWTALWLRRPALIATFHASSAADRPYRVSRRLFGRLVRRVPTGIAVSEAARRCARHVTDRPITVIPNGVTAQGDAATPSSDDSHRIVFVGRNEPRKGLAVLVEALAALPPGVRLDVIGVTGDELPAHDIPPGTRSRIALHGRIGDSDRQQLLDHADLLCAPSLGGESFGLVLLEAMAQGVPVVASDISGYREVLSEGCGVLVPPGDAPALAAALGAVIADADLRERLRHRGRAAAAPFHWQHVAARIDEEYRAAVLAHAARYAAGRRPAADERPARAAEG